MTIARIGDGQPVDDDKINELIDTINELRKIVWADQGALVWNGKTDGFDGTAKYRIVSGSGYAQFNGKSTYVAKHLPFGGVKFTLHPTLFIQPHFSRQCTATVVSKDGDSAEVYFHVSDGGRPPSAKHRVYFSWLAFGPTA
jgi:hypothetical protein